MIVFHCNLFFVIYLDSIVGHIRVIALYLVKKKYNNNKVKTVNKLIFLNLQSN